MEYAYLERK